MVGYARVSTVRQAILGVSLPAQQSAIRSYCELHGISLLDIHTDEGLSGKDWQQRPGLRRAIALIREGEASGLVVHRLDRLCRSFRDGTSVVAALEMYNASLHSIAEQINTSTALGRFTLSVALALGQLEREQIGERTAAALAFKRRKGEKTGGMVPFGFDTIRHGKLVKNAAEQEAISFMRELRDHGLPFRSIARALERRGIRTKTGNRNWHARQVSRILYRHVEARNL